MAIGLKTRIERLEQHAKRHKFDLWAYDLAGRTPEELEYWAKHAVWPGPRHGEPSREQITETRECLERADRNGCFEGRRTIEELKFYCEHGYWPEAAKSDQRDGH